MTWMELVGFVPLRLVMTAFRYMDEQIAVAGCSCVG